MYSSVGLVVVGMPLGSGRQFTPRLTMKKKYNTKCFRPERYRHEMANHYRDYKLQQHLQQQQLGSGYGSGFSDHRRRRRRAMVDKFRVSSLLAPGYMQFRDVWPTHVHYFPRSDDTTYASRGRRTVCSGEPPDETYNDAVRRIKTAHSCEQLRHLVHRIPWRSTCQTSSSDEVPVARAYKSQTSYSGRLDYNLNINRCPAESPQQQLPVDLYGYLQLASGYYERGLQANIKYLQSIGQQKRNATRPVPGLFLDVAQRGESPGIKLTGRLVSLLKGLRRKAAKEKVGDPGISVNIRSVKREKQELKEEDLDPYKALVEDTAERLTSMCDYHAQGCSITESDGATGSVAGEDSEATSKVILATLTSEATFSSSDQRRVYEIIDNLSNLSISDNSSGRQLAKLTLPQITLTDCSAQQVALYNASFDIVKLLIPNEARPPNLNLKAT
ncbi:uncharacterized protein LOC108102404 [Drosophila eugracilis]|uniref:uncharacterized protein LOC108102404 n=1 Tax=Drosophila eugracilis TaxID=29029 RepID=UPI0007E629E4|nr:uncharacterized protein LOC108102404 [Drosophila eugracilis]